MLGYANTLTQNRVVRTLLLLVVCLMAAIIVGAGIATGGIAVAGALIAIPIALVVAGVWFNQPKIGVFTCLVMGFFLFSHSVGALIIQAIGSFIQTGLLLDGCLLVSLLGVLLSAKAEDWARLNNPVLYLLLLWLLYNVFELVNPESISREPWFSAIRGFALYWFELTVIALICLTRKADLDRFIAIWMSGCVVLALWGYKQQYIGLSTEENIWLETVAKSTHVINGVLRSFSLCPDAGQFGAVMSHATVFALIRMLDESSTLKKIGYAILALMFFWGFAVAGSRGPLVIIVVGFALYLVLKRNVAVLIAGGIAGALAFGVLKYTSIGSGVAQVQRMRTALDPEDPSLQLRLYNQGLFANFLATRPFGVGLGLAGDSGKKYWNVVITQQGIDSWYVKIWVETGIVGLVIHGGTLLFILVLGFRKVFKLKESPLRSIMSGLLCGYAGILVASYGNQIYGQSPTCFIIYISIIFFVQSDHFDKEYSLVDRPIPMLS